MLEIATIKNYKNTLKNEWSRIAGLDEGPVPVTRVITLSFH